MFRGYVLSLLDTQVLCCIISLGRPLCLVHVIISIRDTLWVDFGFPIINEGFFPKLTGYLKQQ